MLGIIDKLYTLDIDVDKCAKADLILYKINYVELIYNCISFFESARIPYYHLQMPFT